MSASNPFDFSQPDPPEPPRKPRRHERDEPRRRTRDDDVPVGRGRKGGRKNNTLVLVLGIGGGVVALGLVSCCVFIGLVANSKKTDPQVQADSGSDPKLPDKQSAGPKTPREQISLANGRVPVRKFIEYMERETGLKVHTNKNGVDVTGTDLEFIKNLLGPDCRVHIGGREDYGQNVSALIAQTGKDQMVSAVILETPFDLSQPRARGNDLTSLHHFMYSMLPEASIRTIAKDHSDEIALGKDPVETFGKASVAVHLDNLKKKFRVTITVDP